MRGWNCQFLKWASVSLCLCGSLLSCRNEMPRAAEYRSPCHPEYAFALARYATPCAALYRFHVRWICPW
jgi:hypothetical protein